MDEDLKNVLSYGAGTIFGYSAFLSVLLQFTQDIHLILIDTCLLVLFLWLLFIQFPELVWLVVILYILATFGKEIFEKMNPFKE